MKELGVTAENWTMCQEKMQEAYACISITKKNYTKAIDDLNDLLFKDKKCQAVYAEYGAKGGQAATTVYTQEAWDKLPK